MNLFLFAEDDEEEDFKRVSFKIDNKFFPSFKVWEGNKEELKPEGWREEEEGREEEEEEEEETKKRKKEGKQKKKRNAKQNRFLHCCFVLLL